jgi:hypothetical protein
LFRLPGLREPRGARKASLAGLVWCLAIADQVRNTLAVGTCETSTTLNQ